MRISFVLLAVGLLGGCSLFTTDSDPPPEPPPAPPIQSTTNGDDADNTGPEQTNPDPSLATTDDNEVAPITKIESRVFTARVKATPDRKADLLRLAKKALAEKANKKGYPNIKDVELRKTFCDDEICQAEGACKGWREVPVPE